MNRIAGDAGRWVRIRMWLVGLGLCALVGLLVSTGFGIALRDGADWRGMAERQRQRRLELEPKRGSIYDRHGAALAISVDVPSVSLDAVDLLRDVPPHRLAEVVRSSAERIAGALDLDPAAVESKILKRRRFAWLKHRVDVDQVRAVKALLEPDDSQPAISGLRVDAEGQRYYPGRSLAGPLLGFVSPDGQGREGLELRLNQELAGQRELLRGLRDRNGRVLLPDGFSDERSLAGHDVFLTVDASLQSAVEQELARAVTTFEARSASAVVVIPESGEILALAAAPTYNPNDYRHSDPAVRRLRAVTDAYEPGSALKIFTMAAALESGVAQPSQRMDCHNGVFSVDGVRIPDTHPAGILPLAQVLALSSNICMAQLGLQVGPVRLHETLQKFGFGTPTGLALPGEAGGVLQPRKRAWLPVETANASFGQGLTVTTLQLAMATAAIANKGRLMQPQLVRRVQSSTGEVLLEATPEVRRQVISESVARTVTELMVAVTEGEGTGTQAAIEGYVVAGKTGTAQKVDTEKGGYSRDHFVSTFVGFVPAERPAFTVVVSFDQPALEHGAGTVAAPVFKRIAQTALQQAGILPRRKSEPNVARQAGSAPERSPAAAAVSTAAASAGRASTGSTAERSPAARPPPPQTVTSAEPPKPTKPMVPDLTGMPVRAAIGRALKVGLRPEVHGSGLVVDQRPAPGGPLRKGDPLILEFKPAS